jgi:hypothetical protein
MQPRGALLLISRGAWNQLQAPINQLRAWGNRKRIAIGSAALLVGVVVPVTLVYLGPSDDTNLTGIRPAGLTASSARASVGPNRVRVLAGVKAAGADVVLKINAAESRCDGQISQLAAASTLSATETQTAIQDATGRIHVVAAAFVHQVQVEVADLGNITLFAPDTEQVFLSGIAEVRATALGSGSSQGELGTACQSVLVEVRTRVKPVGP